MQHKWKIGDLAMIKPFGKKYLLAYIVKFNQKSHLCCVRLATNDFPDEELTLPESWLLPVEA